MATNCFVACHTEDGYQAIYVHNDGYPDHMFPLLRDWYGTQERAESLVKLGDASFLDKRLVPSVDSGHSFATPEEDVCIFYHRDRGEPWLHNAPRLYLIKNQMFGDQYYVYIFENGKWTFFIDGKEVPADEIY